MIDSKKKKYLSSLSRQSSETKPGTKFLLVSREPLLYLEFNKPNKQNIYEIKSPKKFIAWFNYIFDSKKMRLNIS